MALRDRGLRFDDDAGQKQDYGRTHFGADQKKSRFSKDMDDMLFGGGLQAPRRRRGQAKKQGQVKKQGQAKKQQEKKQADKKPQQSNNQPTSSQTLGIESKKDVVKPKLNDSRGSQPGNKNVDTSRQPVKPKPSQPVKPKPIQPVKPKPIQTVKPKPIQPVKPKISQPVKPKPSQPQVNAYQKPLPNKPNLNSSNQSGKNIDTINTNRQQEKRPKPVVNNYVDKVAQEQMVQQEKRQEVVEQPKHYHQIQVKRQQVLQVDKLQSFNRPSYIKKLKKVAEDFKFNTENLQRHEAYDVVRPIQCYRDKLKRFNYPGFVDKQFPPESASIGYQHRKENVVFKKPKQIFRSPVFGKYIDPNDIQPGTMSSPQFLSTLSCLAQKQINIKRLIQDQKINDNGYYFVRLNINGVWRYIVVDDNLPQLNDNPIGARSFSDSQGDIWASIIQKAYAKAYSGYNVFNNNVSRQHYLRDLTGAPTLNLGLDEPDLSSIVSNAISLGHPVIAVPNNNIADLGLNPNYSFSVLKCSGRGSLQLRNSWGTLTERPGVSLSKEGVFELSSSHASNYISHIMIAQTDTQICTSTILSKHYQSFYSAYSFSVDNDTRGYISISQLDQRLFSPNNNYRYSPFRVILVKKTEDDESVYVNSGFSHERKNLDVQVNMTAGNYHIYAIGNWLDKQYDYNITVHCYQKVQLKKVYCFNFPNLIAQSLTNQNVNSGKRSAKGSVESYISYHEPSNLVLITAVNLVDKPTRYSQNLQNVKLEQLYLINTVNPEDNFKKKRRDQLQNYKLSALENKVWDINLLPYERFTWVISNIQQYDPSNFKKWGFK